MLAALAQRTGATLMLLPITLPLSAPSLIKDMDALRGMQRVRMIVVDSITSNTAIKMPMQTIVNKLQQLYLSPAASATIPVASVHAPYLIVDAAHSLGSDPSSELSTLLLATSTCASSDVRVDCWITNGHKWLCNNRGAAAMYVSERLRGVLRPAVVSHGSDIPIPPPYSPATSPSSSSVLHRHSSRLHSAFSWDGCRDYSPLLTLPSALALWNAMNSSLTGTGSTIPPSTLHAHTTLAAAIAMLTDTWRPDKPYSVSDFTTEISNPQSGKPSPYTGFAPMILFPLPPKVNTIDTSACTDIEAYTLQNTLHHSGIEVPVKCIGGKLYLRLSCGMYNSADDYEVLAKVVKQLG